MYITSTNDKGIHSAQFVHLEENEQTVLLPTPAIALRYTERKQRQHHREKSAHEQFIIIF